MELIEKGIFLTFDEIMILLYGMGVSEIEGVYMPEKTFHEEEILSALQHLSAIGFIEAGEKKFRIREDIRGLLEIMSTPDYTDIWRPWEEEGPAFFLYRKSNCVVVSEQFFKRKDTLKLSGFTEEAFEKWREELLHDHS